MSRRTDAAVVSVVMAAFEAEDFVAEAIASVLAQTYKPVEVIVVDDGSSDRTAEIAEAQDVEVLRQQHQGASAARNAGLAAAKGEYWTIFDADDVMPPNRLETQVSHLEEHPELGMVLGLTEAFVTPGEPRPDHYNPVWEDGPFPACAGTMLARRSVLDLVGGYDEALDLAYDVDWLARAKDAGVRAGRVDSLCLRYRIHGRNTSSDAAAVHAAMLGLLRSSVHRRQATSTHDAATA
ncbi:MAG: glycosyltransferase family A protein [Acidimicrobiales bacterium]